MSTRIQLQPAFVLHRRKYRETSLLVELLTMDYGRVTAVARGVRRSRSQVSLEPFSAFLVSWHGGGELVTLTQAEADGAISPLQGDCLLAGFYLNELLVRLLQKSDPHSQLYTLYRDTLLKLNTPSLEQAVLRRFEKRLLEELGYGAFTKVETIHHDFLPEKKYRFIPEQGFVACDNESVEDNIFLGKSLLAFALETWHEEQTLRDAKRLARLMLEPLLGPRPLYSRQLFVR
ncbi:MAG: DNA repair protein RecO [Gammaproteobacteria bacterium RIFCSPHIGHO2_12_FULL_42_13]|nr:MAG: DNA repair protein RecO [Gammaproteobacteria bacterium RIFCSPHIGHO2_12_FULL_42_13]